MAPFNPNVSAGRSTAQNRQPVANIAQSVLSGSMTQPERNINFQKKGNLQFPQDLPKEYMRLSLDKFTFGQGFGGLTKSASGGGTNIYLPMPKQMVDNHSVGYNPQSVGGVTGQLTNALTGGSDQSGVGGDILNALAQAGVNAAGKFIENLTGLGATQAFQAQAGVAPNQFLTVMLTGPQFKKHELSWTLSPRNKKESEKIRAIIKELNNAMAPGLFGPFFTHPMVITPSYTNENVLYKFKPCVIENMSINYAPSGAPSFYAKTAAPDSVEIRLSLLEIEFWLTGDFQSTSIEFGGGSGR